MILEPEVLRQTGEVLRQQLLENKFEEAAATARKISAPRVAQILKETELVTQLSFLAIPAYRQAAQYIRSLPPELSSELISLMDFEEAVRICAEIPVDDIADILNHMDEDIREDIVNNLPTENRELIIDLMHYEPDTAGSLMNSFFLAISDKATVAETLEAVENAPAKIENRSYVYVVDDQQKMIGVVSIKDLLQYDGNKKVVETVNKNIVAVHPEDDAFETAQILKARRFQMLPVVDEENRIKGVILLDDVMPVLTRNVADAFSGIGGASPEESFYTPASGSVRMRLPWMAANIFLNLGAVVVISYFEDTIAQVAALAVFLPMITDMGGNVGIQALSVSIRSIALGEVRLIDFWKATRKEIIIGLINGLALGVLFTLVALLIRGELLLGVVAGAALAVNVFVAGVVGGTLPFLIKRLGKDPAMMTGPFLTTITDITGVSIYLGLSTIFLASLLAG